jgi:hypothetical protein
MCKMCTVAVIVNTVSPVSRTCKSVKKLETMCEFLELNDKDKVCEVEHLLLSLSLSLSPPSLPLSHKFCVFHTRIDRSLKVLSLCYQSKASHAPPLHPPPSVRVYPVRVYASQGIAFRKKVLVCEHWYMISVHLYSLPPASMCFCRSKSVFSRPLALSQYRALAPSLCRLLALFLALSHSPSPALSCPPLVSCHPPPGPPPRRAPPCLKWRCIRCDTQRGRERAGVREREGEREEREGGRERERDSISVSSRSRRRSTPCVAGTAAAFYIVTTGSIASGCIKAKRIDTYPCRAFCYNEPFIGCLLQRNGNIS